MRPAARHLKNKILFLDYFSGWRVKAVVLGAFSRSGGIATQEDSGADSTEREREVEGEQEQLDVNGNPLCSYVQLAEVLLTP